MPCIGKAFRFCEKRTQKRVAATNMCLGLSVEVFDKGVHEGILRAIKGVTFPLASPGFVAQLLILLEEQATV